MSFFVRILVFFAVGIGAGSCSLAVAGDWPAWRFDAQRSAATPDELPARLNLQWVRRLPRLTPAWPDQAKMQFDAAYEPIVAGQLLFVGSSHDNSMTAYETRSGKEVWRFFSEGPVRFAPVAWRDKLLFVSDDGHLYCLQARDGQLAWRFRGGPAERWVLGNERMISAWPARGAPVVVDDTVYFAAGIWPFMGVFLHALDAETGAVRWTNDGDSAIYIKQPHNANSFAGVAPQGPLVAIGSKLLIPGGRSVPACYDRATGRLVYYQLAENAKKGGGAAVAATEHLLINGGAAFELANEKYLDAVGELFVIAGQTLYDSRLMELRAIDLAHSQWITETVVDRKGVKTESKKWSFAELARVETPKLTALILAGSRLFAGSKDRLFAYSLPLPKTGPVTPVWECAIDGVPLSLAAADNRLFVTTQDGQILCLADEWAADQPELAELVPVWPPHPDADARARDILQTTGVRAGYGVVWGMGTGDFVAALAAQSSLKWIVVEPNAETVLAFRNRLRSRGVGGERITVLHADPRSISLPPYLASLIVAESIPADPAERRQLVSRSFACLRPFGGVACFPAPGGVQEWMNPVAGSSNLVGGTWKQAESLALLIRAGALPGSADWTHEHADAANTRVSRDTLVKAPLGLLWFGGPSNDSILPRHGHGPQPQICQGRLFIEGVDLLRAIDIYTGRVLWESPLPGVGKFFDNTAHQPGANASGTNYIAADDGIYVAYRDACWKLDPVTGHKIAEFRLPANAQPTAAAENTAAGNTAAGTKTGETSGASGGPVPAAAVAPRWGYLNVVGDFLIAGADPMFDASLRGGRGDDDNLSASRQLMVMDRQSGQVLWTATARHGFRHNAICAGGGRLYCVDRQSGPELERQKRRGITAAENRRLVAFDLPSGTEVWSVEQEVFGTWLSYSADRDVLIEAGWVARDTIGDEPPGMRAYNASRGSVLWHNKKFTGPAMIHHETVLMAGSACDLLTGKPRMREHPLSGELVEWKWSRNYGCNTPLASEHLLTFRSGAAGFFDFCTDGGTGNFGGFRSGCSNNLIVAGGLLNAPDYTRTCTCSYQNQTSLALIPMPDVELWTSFGDQTPQQTLRNVGINLGAPGDRKADDGTLWLEYPSVGGASPEVVVTVEPPQPEWFRRHSSQITGPGIPWVSASGAQGIRTLKVKLAAASAPARKYVVRLHFVEPDAVAAGERVFDVLIQGQPAFMALDVVRESGGQHRSLVKEIEDVEASQELVVELRSSSTGAASRPTILCGITIHAQGW